MKTIKIDVIAPILESYGLCVTCQALIQQAGLDREMEDYPPEWKEDFRRLVEWVLELNRLYGDRLHIRLVDPRSLPGFFKCLRYRVTRYPSFIIEGRRYYVGWNKEALKETIEALLN